MSALVADTHAAIWYLTKDPYLSRVALAALDQTAEANQPIYVPTICVVEATYLAEKGRIPVAILDRLKQVLRDGGFAYRRAPLSLEVAIALGRISRSEVPDMPDRVIAATALALGLPLVTCDGEIRASGVVTIW